MSSSGRAMPNATSPSIDASTRAEFVRTPSRQINECAWRRILQDRHVDVREFLIRVRMPGVADYAYDDTPDRLDVAEDCSEQAPQDLPPDGIPSCHSRLARVRLTTATSSVPTRSREVKARPSCTGILRRFEVSRADRDEPRSGRGWDAGGTVAYIARR